MIPKKFNWRKFLQKAAIPAIVVLVGLTAFGLGRLSALEEQKGVLKIHEPESSSQAAAAQLSAQAGEYVASKGGSKYYLVTCSGAKNIKEENKIWFPTAKAAQSAGYAPAANCPGL